MLVDNLIHSDLHPGNILVRLNPPGGLLGVCYSALDKIQQNEKVNWHKGHGQGGRKHRSVLLLLLLLLPLLLLLLLPLLPLLLDRIWHAPLHCCCLRPSLTRWAAQQHCTCQRPHTSGLRT